MSLAFAFALIRLDGADTSLLHAIRADSMADVATVQDLVLLNANAGGGEDVLIVLDGREERVFVYGLVNRGVEMHVTEDLREVFMRAKQAAGGGR